MQRCDPDSTAHTDHRADLLNMRWLAEWTDKIFNLVALVQRREAMRRLAHGLEYKRDAAFGRVRIRDRQRNALAEIIIELKNDELTRLALLRDQRGTHRQHEYFVRQLFLCEYRVHSIFHTAMTCRLTRA